MKIKKIFLIPVILSLAVISSTFLFEFRNIVNPKLAYILTESGGRYVLPYILALFSFLLIRNIKGVIRKSLFLMLVFVIVSFFFIGITYLNEYPLKKCFKKERPYIELLSKNYNFDLQTYKTIKSKEKRAVFLQEFYDSEQDIIQQSIPQIMKKHWLDETGYSFPSGHSINSFLIASLLSYCFLQTITNTKKALLVISIVFSWSTLVAVSRTVLLAHSPTDILVGSLIGLTLGIIIISTSVIEKISKTA